jgi:TolB-like protein/Tfp pilus assembly protein PilF
MPFVNDSGNADVEYLSDGMTETLISSLSQLPNVNVKGRSSVFRYKGKETDPQTIGKELNVQAILNGRVAQRGDQLRLTLELVDASTENVIWSQQYKRKEADLVALQSEIALDVSTKLRTKLSGADEQKLTKSYTANPEAYQLYLRGRFYWNKRTGESLRKSVEYFNQAIEKDPNYALAYAGMADAYGLIPFFFAGPPQDYFPKAKAAAKKALEIDDTLAEAHTSLALVLLVYDWNIAEANRELQHAIELNLNYPTAHHWYGENLGAMGRFDEAIAELKRAQALDPLSLIINADLGEVYIWARQYDKAIEQLRKTIEMDQSFYYAHWRLGVAYEMKGSLQQAIAEYQSARELNDDPWVLALLGHAYAISGKKDEALKTLDKLRETSKQRYVSEYAFAAVYAGLGEKDQAFQWLEKGYEDRNDLLIQLNVDPLFDNLRSDPRFADLVRRIGLPVVNLERGLEGLSASLTRQLMRQPRIHL